MLTPVVRALLAVPFCGRRAEQGKLVRQDVMAFAPAHGSEAGKRRLDMLSSMVL